MIDHNEPSPPSISRVIRALGELGQDVTPHGKHDYWTHCTHPDHPDLNPSLHITYDTDRVLLHCFSRQCPVGQITLGMGLNPQDLFDVRPGEGEAVDVVEAETVDTPYMAPDWLLRFRSALLESRDLDNLPAPQPLIAGVLEVDSLVWVHGQPGHGKSFVALDMAASVSEGRSWHGRDCLQGTTLYVAAEGTRGLKKRVRAWESYHGVYMHGLRFLPLTVQFSSSEQVAAMVELVTDLQPTLVILDTQARMTSGLDENDPKDMGLFVNVLDRVRTASSACVMALHHDTKAGAAMRGHSVTNGVADTQIGVTKKDGVITLRCTKQKDDEPFEPITLYPVPVGESIVLLDQIEEQDPVIKIVKSMDELGLPADLPAYKVRQYGIKGDDKIIREAVKLRKGRSEIPFDPDFDLEDEDVDGIHE